MAGEATPKTPMGGVKAFSCRNCGGQVQLLAPGQTLVAACQHCGAVADLTDENFRVLSRFRDAVNHQPRFPIGSKATFEGKTWVLIGFMKRTVRAYFFEWEEYLLWNPYHGFRFLAHAYGHWSWIKMIHDGPLGKGKITDESYHGKHFEPLTEGNAEVTFVLGEFYWQVKVGDDAKTYDLIHPPYMLSCEIEDNGRIWSLGEYVEPKVVEEAFGMAPNPKMARKGVAGNQVNRFQANFRKILIPWVLTLIGLLGIYFGFMGSSLNTIVHQGDYRYPNPVDTLGAPFEIPGPINNVEIEIECPTLDNHWMEIEGVLHNVETNANYGVLIGTEYYRGMDGGEAWSEGSVRNSITLNEIPPGKYEFVISSTADTIGRCNLTIHRASLVSSNLLMMLVLVSIVPLYLLIRAKMFEKKRNE